MNKLNIHIDDSYNQYSELPNPKERKRIIFRVDFSGNDKENRGIGSCILKLTQQGALILDSMTEKVKNFYVLA